MKIGALSIAAFVLIGCNAPTRDFRGLDAVRITVEKSTFDIRVDGNRAEAIRTNAEYAPRLEIVAPRAFVAIEKVSGCKVRRLGGDQILIHATLRCGKNTAPLPPLPQTIRYECQIEDFYSNSGLGQEITEMRCDPVRY